MLNFNKKFKRSTQGHSENNEESQNTLKPHIKSSHKFLTIKNLGKLQEIYTRAISAPNTELTDCLTQTEKESYLFSGIPLLPHESVDKQKLKTEFEKKRNKLLPKTSGLRRQP